MIPPGRINKWREHTRARVQKWIGAQLDRYNLSKDEPLITLCQHFESFRATWYKCSSGVWTIGYGYTGSRADIRQAPWDEPYARKVLTAQLRGDYRAEAQRALNLCGLTLEDFSEKQQWAILSLVHNNGPRAIWTKEGRPATWVRLWREGAPREEIEQAWYLWNKSDGEISPGLVRRRYAEMRLFWDGVIDLHPTGWRAYYLANGGK